MSSNLEKFLAKITEKEKKILRGIIEKIIEKDLKGLDVKKLTGHENFFRVRKGDFRIIFKMSKADSKILGVERRADTTYDF